MVSVWLRISSAVPGQDVTPMTITMLLQNTLRAARAMTASEAVAR